MKKLLSLITLVIVLAAGASYATFYGNSQKPVQFYNGHTHDNSTTNGAPQHSGGTDAYGCHNGSVPYHCH